ncbi:MAG: glycosyltransferase family 2 protein [Flavobacteriales bacterium]|nr:glycosyltransferase family 2 protein [Flavobacteriales bacterium]MCB9447730.1 glycosyltransferase family 2 protein [Flavobacteriales bacterium]
MTVLPEISVVIPCRNEEAYIGRCLDAILALDYPQDNLKVYVCDGLSGDRTRGIVIEYAGRHHFIHLLDNPLKTTPNALNTGIREAMGSDVIVILGAHAEVYPDYLNQCVEAFTKGDNIGCVGGVLENVYQNQTSRIVSLAMASPFGVGNAFFRLGNKEGFVDTVAFGAYKREVFERVGMFDADLTRNQDDEFNYRVKKGGFGIYLSPAIRAKYHVRARYRNLFRQYYQYGYWKVFVNRKHRAVTSIRQLVPAFFVLFLLTTPVALFTFPRPWAGVMLSYLGIGLLFAFKKSWNPLVALRVWFTFWILHLAYGTGYLEGVFRFLLLQKNPSPKHQKSSR